MPPLPQPSPLPYARSARRVSSYRNSLRLTRERAAAGTAVPAACSGNMLDEQHQLLTDGDRLRPKHAARGCGCWAANIKHAFDSRQCGLSCQTADWDEPDRWAACQHPTLRGTFTRKPGTAPRQPDARSIFTDQRCEMNIDSILSTHCSSPA